VFCGLFFRVLDPSTLGEHNFLISNPFLKKISASNAPTREGIQVLFGAQKQWSPPFGFGLP